MCALQARHEVTITSTRDRATIARAAVEVVALPTTADLLRWVVQNTIRANHTALLAWARQGATFATTGTPETARLDEPLDLHNMYAAALDRKRAVAAIHHEIDQAVARIGSATNLPVRFQILLDGIRSQGAAFGADFDVVTTAYEEECEREIEKEIESVVLEQPRRSSRTARSEKDWQYHRILDASRASDLSKFGCSFVQLGEDAQYNSCLARWTVDWPDMIFMTTNFRKTVASDAHDQVDRYRRPIDAALIFPETKQIMLLSEREANGVLPYFWSHEIVASRQAATMAPRVLFVNYAYLRDSPCAMEVPLVLPQGHSPYAMLGDTGQSALAVLQLFMGETAYPSEERLRALQDFLHYKCDGNRQELVDALVSSRGTVHTFTRSDLARLLIAAPWLIGASP
jgi:hypothetical protein